MTHSTPLLLTILITVYLISPSISQFASCSDYEHTFTAGDLAKTAFCEAATPSNGDCCTWTGDEVVCASDPDEDCPTTTPTPSPSTITTTSDPDDDPTDPSDPSDTTTTAPDANEECICDDAVDGDTTRFELVISDCSICRNFDFLAI